MCTLRIPVLFSFCMGHQAIKQVGRRRKKKYKAIFGKISLSFLRIFHYALENESFILNNITPFMFLTLNTPECSGLLVSRGTAHRVGGSERGSCSSVTWVSPHLDSREWPPASCRPRGPARSRNVWFQGPGTISLLRIAGWENLPSCSFSHPLCLSFASCLQKSQTWVRQTCSFQPQ